MMWGALGEGLWSFLEGVFELVFSYAVPTDNENHDYAETPWITYLIIAVCVGIFGYEYHLGNKFGHAFQLKTQKDVFIQAYGFSPYKAMVAAGPDKLDGLWQALVGPGGWRSITSMFLHAGFLHVGGNMWILWLFGPNVEGAMGHIRYLIFYIAGGLIAWVAQLMIGELTPAIYIGASGAISAVLGAYLVYFWKTKIELKFFFIFFFRLFLSEPLRVRAIIYLLAFLTMNVLVGMETWGDEFFNVAVWAHVGGFVAGVVLAPLFCDPAFRRHQETCPMDDDGIPIQPPYRRRSLKEKLKRGAEERKQRIEDRGWN